MLLLIISPLNLIACSFSLQSWRDLQLESIQTVGTFCLVNNQPVLFWVTDSIFSWLLSSCLVIFASLPLCSLSPRHHSKERGRHLWQRESQDRLLIYYSELHLLAYLIQPANCKKEHNVSKYFKSSPYVHSYQRLLRWTGDVNNL